MTEGRYSADAEEKEALKTPQPVPVAFGQPHPLGGPASHHRIEMIAPANHWANQMRICEKEPFKTPVKTYSKLQVFS